MAGTRTLKLSILADVDNLTKNLKSGADDVETFGDKVTKYSKVAAAAFLAAGAAAAGMAAKFAVDAVKAASDLSETLSKTNVIFGDASKSVIAFADTAGKSLGQTKQQALDAAATFAIFGKSAGLAGQDLVDFSTEFVTLASDLASFNNTSPEDAIEAIGAALRGEAEPLRRYGVLLDDATLRAKALEMGIYNGSGALNAQQKVLAAQQVILAQTTLAQGDFARTSDGMANSQRILTAQLENMKLTIGEKLLPIVTQFFSYVASEVLPKLEEWSGAIAGVIDNLTGGKGLTDSFDKVAKFYADWFKPIIDGLISGWNSVANAFIRNQDKLQPLFDLLKAVAKFTMETLGPAIANVLGGAFRTLGSVIGTAIDWFADLVQAANNVYNAIKRVIDFIRSAGNKISDFFSGASYSSNPAPIAAAPSMPQFIAASNTGSSTTNNITVNGAIDAEGTARTIYQVLQNSAARTGDYSTLGTSLNGLITA